MDDEEWQTSADARGVIMIKRTLARTIIALAIAALLGGTYLVVENGRTAAGSLAAPAAGFLH